MKRLLHTKQKLKFKNAYVVQLIHSLSREFSAAHEEKYLAIVKDARTWATATWGYSGLFSSYGKEISLYYYSAFADEEDKISSYWFFTDEADALAFKIKAYGECNRIYIWPSRVRFTAYEFVEETEPTSET